MTTPLRLAEDPPNNPPPPPPPPKNPTHPPDGRPPNRKNTGELLDTADLLLRSIELLVSREYPAAFPECPAEVGEVKHSLLFTRRALRDLGDAFPQTPARLSLNGEGQRPGGGPVLTTRPDTGEEPTPGSAAAVAPAACESTDPPIGAGADVPAARARDDGRAGNGAVGAATFTLPPIPTVPSFDNGPSLSARIADQLFDAAARRS
jgi:hypothetical protein